MNTMFINTMYKYKYNARLKIYMFVFLAYIISHTTAQNNSDLPCHANNDCPPDNYCYQTGFCTKCTNCAQYKKQNVTCAQSSDDCGSCMEGYQFKKTDERFDGKPPKYCYEIPTESPSAIAANHTKPTSAASITTEPNFTKTIPSGTEHVTHIPTTEPNFMKTSPSDTEHARAPPGPTEPNITQTAFQGTEPAPASSNGSTVFEAIIIGFTVVCIVVAIFIGLKRYRKATGNEYQRANACEPVECGNQNSTAILIQSTDTIGYANEVSRNEYAPDVNSEPEQPITETTENSELDNNAPTQENEMPSDDTSEVLNTTTQSASTGSSTASSNRPNQDNTNSCQYCSQNKQNRTRIKPSQQLTNINNTFNQQTTFNQINTIIHVHLPKSHNKLENNQNISSLFQNEININKKLPDQKNSNNNQHIYYNIKENTENTHLVQNNLTLLDNKLNIEDEEKCQWLVVKDFFK